MWLCCKHEDSFKIASAFQLFLRGNWIQELQEEMKHREWSPFYFSLLLFSSPFGGGIMQVKRAPTWWKGYRKESSLRINRTGTTALPNKGWLLMDICMNPPHLFCIQPLIMVLSTSQSWLMVVGMQRTVDSADLILGRVGKKRCKPHPPAVYNWDNYSGYHLEDLEEIKASQEPGACEMRQLRKVLLLWWKEGPLWLIFLWGK